MPFARWLVAVDLSTHSGQALRLGAALAELCGGALVAVCVDNRSKPDALLREFVARWTGKPGVPCEVLTGPGAYAVMERADREDFDVVVCGSQGKTNLQRLWLGSFAEKLVRMAGKPVLVVRHPPEERLPRSVLVADDLSGDFPGLAPRARELCARLAAPEAGPTASLLAVHVAARPSFRTGASLDPDAWHAARAEAAEPRLAQLYPDFERVVTAGRPEARILETATERETELIVCGTHRREGLEHFFLGSVAQKLVRLAPCSVLTVPEPRPADVEPPWAHERLDPVARQLELERGP